jgi:uncharacterized protein
LTEIYVDGDACPVREEVYRVAARLRLNVLVVSNGSRPIRPPGMSSVSMVLVGDSADAADDWIAERIKATDVCVTSDIPLASRCLKKGARVVSPTGKQWTEANIGNALAGRDIARHLRELGENTRGPAPLSKQVAVSRRTRHGRAGCIAREGVLGARFDLALEENHDHHHRSDGSSRPDDPLQRDLPPCDRAPTAIRAA